MNHFTLLSNGQRFHIPAPKQFSGGELHVNVAHLPDVLHEYTIKCHLQCTDDIMHMMLLKNALDTRYGNNVPNSIFIPYFPYARQDRACASGDAFSLEIFAQLLYLANFNHVVTLDMHSEAGVKLVEKYVKNFTNVPQLSICTRNDWFNTFLTESNIIFVSPDKGATHKTKELGDHYKKPIIQFRKKRNPVDGSLSGFETDYTGDLSKNTCVIFDDICDGGGTFIGIASILKQLGCKDIQLFVTHGIFSRGLEVFDNNINVVYSTDSFVNDNIISTEHTNYVRIHI